MDDFSSIYKDAYWQALFFLASLYLISTIGFILYA